MSRYEIKKAHDGRLEVWGPSINPYTGYQNLPASLSEAEAENIVRWLSRAFEAGRLDKAAELRDVLGVPARW